MFSPYYNLFHQLEKPFAFVNLDAFDENLQSLVSRSNQKAIRVATKSIRCTDLFKRIFEKATINRWMCFTMEEAVHLSQQGFDDLLVAYPSVQEKYVKQVCEAIKNGKHIILMTDTLFHLEKLNEFAQQENVVLPICADVDVSYDLLGIHFGVYRSSLNSKEKMEAYFSSVKNYPNLKLDGVMTYDAQIAGVGDNQNGKAAFNQAIRFLKKKSIPKIQQRRKEVLDILRKYDLSIRFFNGGGTGSLESTAFDNSVSEVTFGSGLYQSTLFDQYTNFSHKPAAGFVLEICRNPQQNIYTCLGGGYIASGSAGNEKLPSVVFPEQAKLVKDEGAGEVQTPLVCKHELDLEKHNFAIFRHAKAGELCERFNELHLLSKGKLVEKVKTYRGEGKCFL